MILIPNLSLKIYNFLLLSSQFWNGLLHNTYWEVQDILLCCDSSVILKEFYVEYWD